jgi:putative ABC transport system ATP-binding protein
MLDGIHQPENFSKMMSMLDPLSPLLSSAGPSPPSSSLEIPILRCEQLGRTVEGVELISDLNLEVRAGEVLAVVGPSGAGKSTFLRLLNRLDEPTSGTVYLEGNDYRGIDPRDLRRKVGMVTQRPFLFPGQVAENIRFGPRQRGETFSDENVQALLREVGLPGYESRDVSTLSGGEAQRVSLARSLANSPIVLLADEPTSSLDEEAKRGIESLLASIVQHQQLTCIMVTHDMAQAARLASRIAVLEGGRIRKIGGIEEVLRGA